MVACGAGGGVGVGVGVGCGVGVAGSGCNARWRSVTAGGTPTTGLIAGA